MSKQDKLDKIGEEVSVCEKCRLHKGRTNTVPGEGDPDASVVLIGEGPGKNEDQQGSPFVGRAGETLDSLLEENDMDRDSIYITNIVKCRPPNNRDPEDDEVKECTDYLDRQLDIIDPEVIGTLGKYATEYILEQYGFTKKKISEVHGEVYRVKGKNVDKIVPLYHPAASIYNPNLESTMQEDFRKLKDSVEKDESLWNY